MQKRSVAEVVILTIVTCWIYALYWLVTTKDEMVSEGAEIPTGWLIIVPFANVYWYWKFACGVEQVTRGEMSRGVAFLTIWLVRPVGMAIIQDGLNQTIDRRMHPQLPEARIIA